MSGNVINLRQARKRKRRADKEARARANRIRHGRTKEERKLGETLREKHIRHVDGHKRGDDGEGA